MKAPAPLSTALLPTTWGVICVQARQGSVVACHLPKVVAPPRRALQPSGPARLSGQAGDKKILADAVRFVQSALDGRPAPCPPLADDAEGPFTRRARTALRRIKPGQTCTYGELAAAAGSPGAARAAGSACAGNPLPLFIPCHRVLAAGGKLGGFSGGLAWKRILLEREKLAAGPGRRTA